MGLVGQGTFASGSARPHKAVTRHPPGRFAGISRATHRKKPIIATLNGHALGGGFEITLNCDIVMASPTAWFGLPEASRGLYAAASECPRILRICGLRIASEVAKTGRRLSAEEALRFNLVNKISRSQDSMAYEPVEMVKLVAGLLPDAVTVARAGLKEA